MTQYVGFRVYGVGSGSGLGFNRGLGGLVFLDAFVLKGFAALVVKGLSSKGA